MQRPDRRSRSGIGKRAHHNHRHRMRYHEFGKKCYSVHTGHFHIERKHIGLKGLYLVHSNKGIDRCTHHFYRPRLRQRIGQQFSSDRRIIND